MIKKLKLKKIKSKCMFYQLVCETWAVNKITSEWAFSALAELVYVRFQACIIIGEMR